MEPLVYISYNISININNISMKRILNSEIFKKRIQLFSDSEYDNYILECFRPLQLSKFIDNIEENILNDGNIYFPGIIIYARIYSYNKLRHSYYKASPIMSSLLCSRDSHPNNTYSSRDNQNGLPSVYTGGILSERNFVYK